MKPQQFDRLVENLRKDGVLTSTPLIYKGEIVSGNHRTMAAIKAGIEEADCIEIVSELTHDQKIQIQLSHNAIVGEDDPNTLRDLYGGLGLEGKLYSGLTDDVFDDASSIELQGLALGEPTQIELVFSFLMEDEAVFSENLKEIEKRARKARVHLARFADFDRLFDAIIAVKKHQNILNSSMALAAMAELALQRLDQLETEETNGAPSKETRAEAQIEH